MATAVVPSARVSSVDGPDDVLHVVSWWRYLLDRLRIKIPRSLCGVTLDGDPGCAWPPPDAPVCLMCAMIAGWGYLV